MEGAGGQSSPDRDTKDNAQQVQLDEKQMAKTDGFSQVQLEPDSLTSDTSFNTSQFTDISSDVEQKSNAMQKPSNQNSTVGESIPVSNGEKKLVNPDKPKNGNVKVAETGDVNTGNSEIKGQIKDKTDSAKSEETVHDHGQNETSNPIVDDKSSSDTKIESEKAVNPPVGQSQESNTGSPNKS